MKKYIVVTGGAGFIGSNLIKYLLLSTKNKIISLDNYSTGSKTNHAKNRRVKYINADTIDIRTKLDKYKKKHRGHFSFWRICTYSSKLCQNRRLLQFQYLRNFECFLFLSYKQN